MEKINLPENVGIIKVVNDNVTTLIAYWKDSTFNDIIQTIEMKKLNSGYDKPVIKLYSSGTKNDSDNKIFIINGINLIGIKNDLIWNHINPEIRIKEQKQSFNNSKLFMDKKINGTINIHDLTGDIREMKIFPNMTINDIKEIIEDIDGISSFAIRLIFAGRQLYDDDTIEKCHIVNGSSVHMVLALRGGMYHQSSGKAGNYQKLKKNKIIAINDDLKLTEILKNIQFD